MTEKALKEGAERFAVEDGPKPPTGSLEEIRKWRKENTAAPPSTSLLSSSSSSSPSS